MLSSTASQHMLMPCAFVPPTLNQAFGNLPHPRRGRELDPTMKEGHEDHKLDPNTRSINARASFCRCMPLAEVLFEV